MPALDELRSGPGVHPQALHHPRQRLLGRARGPHLLRHRGGPRHRRHPGRGPVVRGRRRRPLGQRLESAPHRGGRRDPDVPHLQAHPDLRPRRSSEASLPVPRPGPDLALEQCQPEGHPLPLRPDGHEDLLDRSSHRVLSTRTEQPGETLRDGQDQSRPTDQQHRQGALRHGLGLGLQQDIVQPGGCLRCARGPDDRGRRLPQWDIGRGRIGHCTSVDVPQEQEESPHAMLTATARHLHTSLTTPSSTLTRGAG